MGSGTRAPGWAPPRRARGVAALDAGRRGIPGAGPGLSAWEDDVRRHDGNAPGPSAGPKACPARHRSPPRRRGTPDRRAPPGRADGRTRPRSGGVAPGGSHEIWRGAVCSRARRRRQDAAAARRAARRGPPSARWPAGPQAQVSAVRRSGPEVGGRRKGGVDAVELGGTGHGSARFAPGSGRGSRVGGAAGAAAPSRPRGPRPPPEAS